jgi:monoamine oxidase
MSEIKTDFIIIGAGYSGIAAASKLFEMGKNFVVVEARDRIGGRVWSRQLDNGAIIDIGAQWIGPDQKLMWEMVKKYNIDTFETYDTGKNILAWNSKLSHYIGTIPKIDPISLIDLGLALNKINRLCKQIPLDNPWLAKNAKALDATSLFTWVEKNMWTEKAKFIFKVGIETVFACNPSEISMLHALFYAHSGEDFERLISIKDGAQQTRFVRGSQHLLEKMAFPFKEKILLDSPVLSIEQNSDGVLVKTSNAQIFASKCIIAIPPTLVQKIKFLPELPPNKIQLNQRMPMGTAMKCFAIYKKPFWRAKGFSGQVVSNHKPVQVTFDCSPKDESCGIILGFIEADNARNFIEKTEAERKAIFFESLAKYFGPEALDSIDYVEKCWSTEEWSGGCYAGNPTMGTLSQFGIYLRKPVGNIYWAGTETAIRGNGYMEGALEAGYRAAKEAMESSVPV